MSPSLRGPSARSRFALVTLVPIVVMAGLLLFAPPDGQERAQWIQFIGRFHPLSVHVPIALLVLVPLFELAGRRPDFSYLLPAVDFLLGVALCGAIFAVALGWCMARSGGYSGPLLTQHMWSGITVAAATWLCWMFRGGQNLSGRPYTAMLIATVILVSFTGYRGGQLSQGENHLTEFMPRPLRSLLGLTADDLNPSSADPHTFYGARVQPLFSAHCVTCHGPNKHKAELRLNSYTALSHGGKHGAVLKPGDPKNSELFRRITLPSSDEDFMPADHKRPFSPAEVNIIEQWIAAGASATQPVDAIRITASESASPAPEVTFAEIDLVAVAKQRAAGAPVVAQLQQRLPNIVQYQSRDSADIAVTASWMQSKFGDAELSSLSPLADRIVSADFSNTAITDKSASTIAAMKHLHTLRLMHTRITDMTVEAMEPLNELESLSLFDTPITPAALKALGRLPRLRHVYVGGTKISAETPLPPEISSKLVF